MLDLVKLNADIAAPDEAAMNAAQARWDAIAKPLGSLGLLEDAVVRIAGLTGSADVSLHKRAVLVLCADNGVVAEGVTQTGQDITALVAGNIAAGDASVCRMSAVAGADVIPVDMGMVYRARSVMDRRIAAGPHNMAEGPAMSRAQAETALTTGIELVREYKSLGYRIFATGEMGIGNTTTSSAVAAVLLGLPIRDVTGRGAGLSDDGLIRKIRAIERAVAVNAPDPSDALDVLHKLGGFDIAGLAGVFLGGALYRVPVLVDGFISAVSALVAARLCPQAVCAMLASHVSAEPAAKMTLEALGLEPLIRAGMRLGEGTGAVCALPLLDMALAVYKEMQTFGGIGMEAYTPQGGF
jgi:nicotinate-nucleotide--dimethylbenzimidazole phosphoribosyltransferase